MPVGNLDSSIALQLERVRRSLPKLFALDDTIFNLILRRTERDQVSFRPSRIPFQVSNGTVGQVVNLDGADMGRGGGPRTTYGALAPVQFDWIIEWTKAAELGTDSSEKAIVRYATEILRGHIQAAQHDLGALIAVGDGANTIGTVTAYNAGTFAVTVDNAARFRADNSYDVYNGGIGTALTTTITPMGVDYINRTLYLPAAPSAAPAANAAIAFRHSSYVAGTGINGFGNLQSIGTTGSFMGVPKANFPGNFVTPSINAGGVALTPQIARMLLNYIYMNVQLDSNRGDLNDFRFIMGVDQAAAWENVGLIITQIMQTGAAATGRDMLAARQVETIAGVQIIRSRFWNPGRIDLVDLRTWFVSQVQELDYYTVGNVETFWPMGASGGIAAAMLKYLIWVGNLGCDNPGHNGVIYNLQVPAGY
jgi:hypothetical protein